MLRIYLDWNVISNLKRDGLTLLKEHLTSSSKDILVFYTPAHFGDLMKSESDDNPYFEQDLETLTYLCGDHLVRWDASKGIQANNYLPRDYLPLAQEYVAMVNQMTTSEGAHGDHPLMVEEKEKIANRFHEQLLSSDDHQSKALIKQVFPGISDDPTVAELYDAMPDFIHNTMHDGEWYKIFRTKFQESGMKVETNAGNWKTEEVIERVDAFMTEAGFDAGFSGIQDLIETATGTKRSFYDKFISSYQMLDLMGYKADKLPKPTDSMNNISMDAEHAFYATHADIFVVGDKKLAVKAKVLYHYYGVDTLVVKPNDFQGRFTEILASKRSKPVFDHAGLLTLISSAKFTGHEVHPGPPLVSVSAFKLPKRVFGFFNHLIVLTFEGRPGALLEFKLANKERDNFLFPSEFEHLTRQLAAAFPLSEEPARQLREFLMEQPPGKELSWTYADCYWTLKKGKDGFPILIAGTLSNAIKQLVDEKRG